MKYEHIYIQSTNTIKSRKIKCIIESKKIPFFAGIVQNRRHMSDDVIAPATTSFAPIRSCRRQSGRAANNLPFLLCFSSSASRAVSLRDTPLTLLIMDFGLRHINLVFNT